MSADPRPGPELNAGAWFGTLLGGTSWMPLAAIAVGRGHAMAALGLLVLWLALAGVGTATWFGRARLARGTAAMILVALGCGGSLAGLVLVHASGQWRALGRAAGGAGGIGLPPWAAYAIVTGIGVLLAWRLRRTARGDAPPPP